ncbi:hypothetical protein [Halobacillus sp. B29]|uniref:hypothetical protein n=1 Tax=Halobacillus sp. B29 TaxID=3457432 RepID=UPI003FCC4011
MHYLIVIPPIIEDYLEEMELINKLLSQSQGLSLLWYQKEFHYHFQTAYINIEKVKEKLNSIQVPHEFEDSSNHILVSVNRALNSKEGLSYGLKDNDADMIQAGWDDIDKALSSLQESHRLAEEVTATMDQVID